MRRVIADHRRWFRDLLRDLLTAARHPDAECTAAMLAVLRDGLIVGSDLGDPAEVRDLTRAAVERILTHFLPLTPPSPPPAGLRPGCGGRGFSPGASPGRCDSASSAR